MTAPRTHGAMTRAYVLIGTLMLLPGCVAANDVAEVDCALEDRADVYAPGMSKAGADYTVSLIDSLPAPPSEGDNAWIMEITNGAGATIDDLELSVSPFMPDDGHGTPVRAAVTPAGADGQYSVDPVNLWMPGYWEVRIDVDDGAGIPDSVVFGFCIED